MHTPKINVLIRTSNREEKFARCVKSIRDQPYDNVRIVVCSDYREDLAYIRPHLKEGDHYFSVSKVEYKAMAKNSDYFYNLYCNALASWVFNGWIIYLDDDDQYVENAFSDIYEFLKKNKFNNNYLYIWQMRNEHGRVHPCKRHLQLADIGTPMFCVHSTKKHLIKFGYSQTGDGEAIIHLAKNLEGVEYLEKVLVEVEGPH